MASQRKTTDAPDNNENVNLGLHGLTQPSHHISDQQFAEAQAALKQVPMPLPPEHVNHDAVFYNEVNIRHQGFIAGLEAVDAEIAGRKIEREEKIAEIERAFASDMASLERRRTMMVIGMEMAQAAMDRFNDLQPQSQPAPEDETEES